VRGGGDGSGRSWEKTRNWISSAVPEAADCHVVCSPLHILVYYRDIETKYHFTFPRDMYVVSLDFLLFLPIATTVYSKKLHCLLQSNTFFFIASNFLNAASGMLFCSYEAAASNPVAID
jgi:hypothetical protein